MKNIKAIIKLACVIGDSGVSLIRDVPANIS